MQTITQELVEPVFLCDRQGLLHSDACGWARQPLITCNLKGRFLRKKKWDYWCIVGERFLLSVTIANADYMAIGSVYFFEYEGKRFTERTIVKPFARKPAMPETVCGDIELTGRDFAIRFEREPSRVGISVDGTGFSGRRLTAEVEISKPAGIESLNVVVPWNARTFQFTSKQLCLPATGAVTWGGESFAFEEGAWACLDFGRGIWPYRTVWNWGVLSYRTGGDDVGVTMGAQWTDGTGMTENGILLNGKLHKIYDDIAFDYDPRDFLAPWRIHTVHTDEVSLTLEPFYERPSKVNLGILRSEAHQVFGRYRGTLCVGDRELKVENALGWAEEHRARW